MSRKVQVVLLCEDSQHEAFARRFLEKERWSIRQIRVVKAPRGSGSGEQFIRNHFPDEIKAYRSRKHHVACALLVLVDGDKIGVKGRMGELDDACRERGISSRYTDEDVLVFVPTWRIETWLAYLEGQAADETKRDYPRLPRERDCREHVNVLVNMCQKNELRQPAPCSLIAACEEHNRWANRLQRR